ncbi:hypothetical protein Lal_00039230 [Lupinus albus]|nr:hypothetical protein Lal_00039230 [Lupinus albus]
MAIIQPQLDQSTSSPQFPFHAMKKLQVKTSLRMIGTTKMSNRLYVLKVARLHHRLTFYATVCANASSSI